MLSNIRWNMANIFCINSWLQESRQAAKECRKDFSNTQIASTPALATKADLGSNINGSVALGSPVDDDSSKSSPEVKERIASSETDLPPGQSLRTSESLTDEEDTSTSGGDGDRALVMVSHPDGANDPTDDSKEDCNSVEQMTVTRSALQEWRRKAKIMEGLLGECQRIAEADAQKVRPNSLKL